MKTILKLRNIFTIILVITILSCSSDDSPNQDNDYNISFATFSIDGKKYDFRDASSDDEYKTFGYLYTKAEDPDLSDDQIQVNIRKSLTESNFFLVAPPNKGSHSINHQGGNDFEIGIKLVSHEDYYYAKAVIVNISELEIDNNNIVKHCKGKFSGSFYRINLEESNVRDIEGDFDIYY